MRPGFVWSPHYEVNIGRHVFPTEKFRLLMEKLIADGRLNSAEVQIASKALDEQLLGALTADYLNDLRGYKHVESTKRSELPITKEIIDGMEYVAGGSILCAELALERGAACHLGGGFHHGFSDHAEGFCYINDIAVAVQSLLNRGLAKRVAIIDTDVHQGNGTARIFQGNRNVYTFSIHEENLYPYLKEASSLDIGLPSRIDQDLYLAKLNEGLFHTIDRFAPDFVVYAAGVDPFENDQLGRLGLTWETMRQRDLSVVRKLVAAEIPFMTVVAGGYSRQLSETVGLHAQTVECVLEAMADHHGTRRQATGHV